MQLPSNCGEPLWARTRRVHNMEPEVLAAITGNQGEGGEGTSAHVLGS